MLVNYKKEEQMKKHIVIQVKKETELYIKNIQESCINYTDKWITVSGGTYKI